MAFFPSDWLAGTRGMTAAETGVYITLIAMMYERAEPLNFDRPKLARLCGIPAGSFRQVLSALWQTVKSCKPTLDCGAAELRKSLLA